MSEIRVVDRTDEVTLRAAWEVGRAVAVTHPHDDWPAWELCRRTWTQPNPERDLTYLVALEDGVVVGCAWVGLPVRDDLHLTHLELYVDPTRQRRGHGTALLAAVEQVGRDGGRTTFLADTVVPLPDGDDGADGGEDDGAVVPGLVFAERHGYERVSTDEAKVADLTAGEADLARLQVLAAQWHQGYALQVVDGRVPNDLIDGVCALLTRFWSEVPLEGVDRGRQVWTPERYRQAEARWDAAGRRHLQVLARAPGGELVGYSDLTVADAAPERAEIAGTLVLPEHRGHRLGLALKVRLHRLVGERCPAVRSVTTWNAAVNDHMNAVNAELGYRVVQLEVGLQKKV